LVVGEKQPCGRLTISGEITDKNGTPVTGKAVVVVINPDSKSIKEKFSVDPALKEAEAVDAAFRELSTFIEKGGLTDPATKNVINLGDYIELEGGLEVEAYPDVDGGFSSDDDPYWNAEITAWGVSLGRMNRLIVVGINSFKDSGSYKYPKGQSEPDPSDHVVFQFQNSPVTRRMNPDSSNAGGYPASEMRKYLTGNFLAGLTGLENAGVPADVLWGPSRVMSTKGGAETINDLLWLPTEREIYGTVAFEYLYNLSEAEETERNQAKLAYYKLAFQNADGDLTDETILLFQKASKITAPNYPVVGNRNSPAYWLASAYNKNSEWFCLVRSFADSGALSATLSYGVSPAFCVYGLKPQQ
jgi:hypothetical protein